MVMETTDHLSDKEFRRLTFDMMLAWEAPAPTNQPVAKVRLHCLINADVLRLYPTV